MAHRRLAGALLGQYGIHPGQERLLFALADGPAALGTLAAALGVNAPTVTKMVARMERAGMVTTTASTDDRRVRLVTLTQQGTTAAKAALEVWERLEATTVAGLDPEEQRQLADLLGRCAKGLEEALPSACGSAPDPC